MNMQQYIDPNFFLIQPPTAEEIKKFRLAAKLSTDSAAKILKLSDGSIWRKYESGKYKPNTQTWTLFLLITNQHPHITLTSK